MCACIYVYVSSHGFSCQVLLCIAESKNECTLEERVTDLALKGFSSVLVSHHGWDRQRTAIMRRAARVLGSTSGLLKTEH